MIAAVHMIATPLAIVDGSIRPIRSVSFPTGKTTSIISGMIVNGLKPVPNNVLGIILRSVTSLRFPINPMANPMITQMMINGAIQGLISLSDSL